MFSASSPSALERPVSVTGNGGMYGFPSVWPNFCSAVLSVADGSDTFWGKRIVPGLSVFTSLYLARSVVVVLKSLASGLSIPPGSLPCSWKRAVDWSAPAPGGVTDSSIPGSVGHFVTEVTKWALPSPVAGRSTISMFTFTGGSVSAQHALVVKKVYWRCQIPVTVAIAFCFQFEISSAVHANFSGPYFATLSGPTEATQVGSAGSPLRNSNAIPSVIVSRPSPGA